MNFECSMQGESQVMCTWLWQSFAVERLASCPQSVGSSLERPNARARKKVRPAIVKF